MLGWAATRAIRRGGRLCAAKFTSACPPKAVGKAPNARSVLSRGVYPRGFFSRFRVGDLVAVAPGGRSHGLGELCGLLEHGIATRIARVSKAAAAGCHRNEAKSEQNQNDPLHGDGSFQNGLRGGPDGISHFEKSIKPNPALIDARLMPSDFHHVRPNEPR